MHEDNVIAKNNNVDAGDVFIISRAQGYETDEDTNLLVKFAYLGADIVKAKKGSAIFASIKAWAFDKIFKPGVDHRQLAGIKFYICAEVPANLIAEELVLTAALKEAAFIIVKDGVAEPMKIIEKG